MQLVVKVLRDCFSSSSIPKQFTATHKCSQQLQPITNCTLLNRDPPSPVWVIETTREMASDQFSDSPLYTDYPSDRACCGHLSNKLGSKPDNLVVPVMQESDEKLSTSKFSNRQSRHSRKCNLIQNLQGTNLQRQIRALS